MAKTKMVCPFSKVECRECPLYRGRHVHLCFYRRYPQNVNKSNPETWETGNGKQWALPELPANPTWLTLTRFEERDAHHDKRR